MWSITNPTGPFAHFLSLKNKKKIKNPWTIWGSGSFLASGSRGPNGTTERELPSSLAVTNIKKLKVTKKCSIPPTTLLSFSFWFCCRSYKRLTHIVTILTKKTPYRQSRLVGAVSGLLMRYLLRHYLNIKVLKVEGKCKMHKFDYFLKLYCKLTIKNVWRI